jgi:hypothetical protein
MLGKFNVERNLLLTNGSERIQEMIHPANGRNHVRF